MRLAWIFTFHLFLHPFSVFDDIYLDCRWWFPKQIQNKPFVESILCRWWGRHRGNSKESYRCGNLRWGGNQFNHAWKLDIENDVALINQFSIFFLRSLMPLTPPPTIVEMLRLRITRSSSTTASVSSSPTMYNNSSFLFKWIDPTLLLRSLITPQNKTHLLRTRTSAALVGSLSSWR